MTASLPDFDHLTSLRLRFQELAQVLAIHHLDRVCGTIYLSTYIRGSELVYLLGVQPLIEDAPVFADDRGAH